MLSFREIKLEDREWMAPLLEKSRSMSCEFCFGNHYIWKNTYRVKVARFPEHYVLSTQNEEGRKGTSFLYPVGGGDTTPVIRALLEHAGETGIPFRMHSVPEEALEALNRDFPGRFSVELDRDYMDYIYRVDELVALSGKRFHGKRNFLARFYRQNWSFEPITAENLGDCLKMNGQWCENHGCRHDPTLREEACAVGISLRHFADLHFFGGLLRVDGQVVAYTLAEELNPDTVVIHMEKAFSHIPGAYPAINREFLAQMCEKYTYVNREEDLGVEGLRKAKLSYYPTLLLPKYLVTERK